MIAGGGYYYAGSRDAAVCGARRTLFPCNLLLFIASYLVELMQ